MTDQERQGDPTSAPFWDAARRRELVAQRCSACGAHQLYGRPFCLACDADAPPWVQVSGRGTVYTAVHVRIPVVDELPVPYSVGLVELDEGPRLLARLEPPCPIGARVVVGWRDRQGQPPVPVFHPEEPEEEVDDGAA